MRYVIAAEVISWFPVPLPRQRQET